MSSILSFSPSTTTTASPGSTHPVETALGHRFRDPTLLELALTHRSYRFEHPEEPCDNQRLEYLGDAVLQLLAAEWTYRRLQDQAEGGLTISRSRLVSTPALAGVARDLSLGEHLRLGRGEALDGGAGRDALLADALEAVLAAVYLDAGLVCARRVFKRLFASRLKALDADPWDGNPKGRLQQLVQQCGDSPPTYRTLAESGPPHRRRFEVEVTVTHGGVEHGRTLLRGIGQGVSKQAAQVAAADALLEQMRLDADP